MQLGRACVLVDKGIHRGNTGSGLLFVSGMVLLYRNAQPLSLAASAFVAGGCPSALGDGANAVQSTFHGV
jgi:hypothetical protein